uniref:NADH dehydrogenase subunit 6 n=1 Tax=Ricania fumosa TaxID=130627 RepID=UPI001EDDCF6D|nr:NADH dehydrogenase subunit 6 [Ricania fumosa]UJT96898.1 NADH dehydrogenase subunit 6 [Ricania fumosa]
MLSKMIMLTSMITMTMKHPVSMGSMLMIQTILLSNMMFKESEYSWFAYILFITIIGGMMIMFMYMASIASNEKFETSIKQTIIFTTMITMTMIMYKEFSMEKMNKMVLTKFKTMQNLEISHTTKFFNLNKMNITILMMMTLLLTMIVVTNISSTFEGPLKKN